MISHSSLTFVSATSLVELLGLTTAAHVLVEPEEGDTPLMGDDLVEVVHSSQQLHAFQDVGGLKCVLEADAKVLAGGLHGWGRGEVRAWRARLPWFGRGGFLEYFVLPISIRLWIFVSLRFRFSTSSSGCQVCSTAID